MKGQTLYDSPCEVLGIVKFLKRVESRLPGTRVGVGRMRSYWVARAEFQFVMMKMFFEWMVVMAEKDGNAFSAAQLYIENG